MKIEKSIHVSFDENRNGNDFSIGPEEGEFLFQVDGSMGPSNQVVDDIVVHTLNRDDVPTTTTNVPKIQDPETEQVIEEDADVPIGDGVGETQAESSSNNPQYRYMTSHPSDLRISDPNTGVRTRSSSVNTFLAFNAFISQVEPKNIKEALC